MDRLPERGRTSRLAEPARITPLEKKETTKSRSKTPVRAARLKIVWEVCSGTGAVVKTFSYPERAAAEAKTKALTMSTRRAHMLREARVPMG